MLTCGAVSQQVLTQQTTTSHVGSLHPHPAGSRSSCLALACDNEVQLQKDERGSSPAGGPLSKTPDESEFTAAAAYVEVC